jgi:hypothetical protein
VAPGGLAVALGGRHAHSLLAVLAFLPGCPFGGCSYAGQSDLVYQRGNDTLTLCENGGFVAAVNGQTITGTYTDSSGVPGDAGYTAVGTEGGDGAHAFDLSTNADDSVTLPQYGSTPFTKSSLDQAELNYADVPCQDLETQSWWK